MGSRSKGRTIFGWWEVRGTNLKRGKLASLVSGFRFRSPGDGRFETATLHVENSAAANSPPAAPV